METQDKKKLAYEIASQLISATKYSEVANDNDINNELEEISLELQTKSELITGDLCFTEADREVETEALKLLKEGKKMAAINHIRYHYKLKLKPGLEYTENLRQKEK